MTLTHPITPSIKVRSLQSSLLKEPIHSLTCLPFFPFPSVRLHLSCADNISPTRFHPKLQRLIDSESYAVLRFLLEFYSYVNSPQDIEAARCARITAMQNNGNPFITLRQTYALPDIFLLFKNWLEGDEEARHFFEQNHLFELGNAFRRLVRTFLPASAANGASRAPLSTVHLDRPG